MPNSFECVRLNNLVEFDALLGELIQAGVPLHWNARCNSETTRQYSKRVVEEMTRRTSKSPVLESNDADLANPDTDFWDTFAALASISPYYRFAFAAWIATDGSPNSLMILRDIRSDYPSINLAWIWKFYLKIFLILALGVFILWQLTGGAELRKLYEGSLFPPGPISQFTTLFNGAFERSIPQIPWPVIAFLLLQVPVLLYIFLFRLPSKNNKLEFRLSSKTEQAIAGMRFIDTLVSQGISVANANEKLQEILTDAPVLFNERTASFATNDNSVDHWLNLNAQQWGTKRKIEQQLHKRASVRPLLVYLAVGSLITLLLAILIFLPMYEYIYELEIEKRF